MMQDLYEGYELADGVITEKKPWSTMSDIREHCTLSYTVDIDGEEYSEQDTHDTDDYCYLEAGDTIKIKYLQSDARKHEVASESEVKYMTQTRDTSLPSDGSLVGSFSPFMIVPLVIFAVVFGFVIFNIIRTSRKVHSRMSDTDGDGLSHDNKPATAEQKKLIQEGFRKLGIFHDVKKKLTQAQARETLKEIDRQLKQK